MSTMSKWSNSKLRHWCFSTRSGTWTHTNITVQRIFLPHYVTIVKQSLVFQTLLCFQDIIHFVCCGLDCLFTLLKFLQDSYSKICTLFHPFEAASLSMLNIDINFNLGICRSVSTRLWEIYHYGVTSIYFIAMLMLHICLFSFSLGVVLHLLFRAKQHQKSSMSKNAVLLVLLLDFYHFKDFHRI